MKKSFMLLLLIVLFVLPVSAFAQDDWKPIEYNTEGTEAIECEIQEPRGMNEAVMEKLSPITEEDWSIGPRMLPPPAHASEALRDLLAHQPAPKVYDGPAPATAEEWRKLIDARHAEGVKAAEIRH